MAGVAAQPELTPPWPLPVRLSTRRWRRRWLGGDGFYRSCCWCVLDPWGLFPTDVRHPACSLLTRWGVISRRTASLAGLKDSGNSLHPELWKTSLYYILPSGVNEVCVLLPFSRPSSSTFLISGSQRWFYLRPQTKNELNLKCVRSWFSLKRESNPIQSKDVRLERQIEEFPGFSDVKFLHRS